MGKVSLIFIGLLLNSLMAEAQPVHGLIYKDTLGVQVVKIWGTHQERGYALGYLTGAKITDIIINYIKPQFGSYYTLARTTVIQGNDITIPQTYKDEAQAMIDGMNASGTNTTSLDQTDILVSNSFLDIQNVFYLKNGPGCSGLMSWNTATLGTDLDGKSVISRHLDWTISSVLYNNNVIIVHFPFESNESKWLLIGFSGMMGALSGLNPDFGAFQHQMVDVTNAGIHNMHYLPIWLAIRNGLERQDYNGDGLRNVQDIHSSLNDCSNGFAAGFIVTSLARTSPTDSLVAMVAELAPVSPTRTFRYNDYPDSIPDDNLYASNYEIKRNNARHYDVRYLSIVNHIGNGTNIGLDTNWNLMKNYSIQTTNLQFMEYSPEMNVLRLSVYRDNQPAYMNDPVVFTLSELFDDPGVGINEKTRDKAIIIYPDPAEESISIAGIFKGNYEIEIFNVNGRMVKSSHAEFPDMRINVSSLPPGFYMARLTGNDFVYTGRFLKDR
ncbi:MAG: T9SS type A sorting domain-containing protein [Bacteroidetes bacterium]|nr:T9SS type A sorting domain-containing protein [Bacteroidota bacterium]